MYTDRYGEALNEIFNHCLSLEQPPTKAQLSNAGKQLGHALVRVGVTPHEAQVLFDIAEEYIVSSCDEASKQETTNT